LAKPTSLPKYEVATFGRCKIIKGNPQIWGAPLAHGHAHFFSWCDFMMALNKPTLHTKFEVAMLSCCRNIKGKPQNFRKLP